MEIAFNLMGNFSKWSLVLERAIFSGVVLTEKNWPPSPFLSCETKKVHYQIKQIAKVVVMWIC